MKQKGFTLIEMVAAIAVGGMLLAGALASIYQVVWGSARTNDQVIALNDVNYAAMWIRRDLQMAQETNLIDGDPVPQSSLELRWVDNTGWATDETRNHSANYTLSGTKLLRNYDGTVSVVGRYISSIGFTQKGRVVFCTITSTGPGVTKRDEPLRFSVVTHLRPEETE
jgi:prepilin-type N-terminal cleavage/methylation domain-containing protein